MASNYSSDLEMFDDNANSSSRVEVYRDEQSLNLKINDITVERLSRVFKLKPTSIYLEEDITKNVEFPLAGKFVDIRYGRFKCCGELDKNAPPNTNVEESPVPTAVPSQPWSLPRPWTNAAGSSSASGSSFSRKKTSQPYEAFLKRSFPYVALGLDQSGRNIIVESTINNVYVKIPENAVSGQAILSVMATKIGCEVADLNLLDVKFIEVSDDKDLEYWKAPSRRFYVCKKEEYDSVVKVRARKRLTLNRKRTLTTYSAAVSDEEDSSHGFGFARLETKLSKIDSDFTKYVEENEEVKRFKSAKREISGILQCKICKDIPSYTSSKVMVLCCNQIMGCQSCLTRCLQESSTCPLCRADNPRFVVVNGLDQLYSLISD